MKLYHHHRGHDFVVEVPDDAGPVIGIGAECPCQSGDAIRLIDYGNEVYACKAGEHPLPRRFCDVDGEGASATIVAMQGGHVAGRYRFTVANHDPGDEDRR